MVLNFDLIKFLSKRLAELSYDNHKNIFKKGQQGKELSNNYQSTRQHVIDPFLEIVKQLKT